MGIAPDSFFHLNCSREWLLAVSPSELSRRSAKQLGSERVKINRGQADGNIRKRFGCRVPTIVPSANFRPVGFQKVKCYSLCVPVGIPKKAAYGRKARSSTGHPGPHGAQDS